MLGNIRQPSACPHGMGENDAFRKTFTQQPRGVDVAIRSGSLARVPGHVQTTWFKAPWVVCASPAYLKGRQQPRQPNDLTGHQLIGFRNQRTGQVRPWSFRQAGKRGSVIQSVPDPMTIYDDGGSAWNAALHGGGIVSAVRPIFS